MEPTITILGLITAIVGLLEKAKLVAESISSYNAADKKLQSTLSQLALQLPPLKGIPPKADKAARDRQNFGKSSIEQQEALKKILEDC
jgi:hypothetical protein